MTSEGKKKIVFVANPISGTHNKRLILKKVDELLDRDRYDFEVVTTEYAGHATEIARSAANSGVDIVCAIGGDGTVNETARALVHTDTALAIIPCGSGNGLARHLSIPMDPTRAIRLINEGPVQRIDYGIVNFHPFFCTCGVGFDAEVSQRFAEANKRGPISYVEQVLKTYRTFNPETYELTVEDEQSGTQTYEAVIIACANASQYGNNVYIAPQASVQDGLMDVTIIQPFPLIDVTPIAFQLINGTLSDSSYIKTLRCKQLTIRRKKAGVIHCDGDPFDAEALIDVSIVPQGMSCIFSSEARNRNVGNTLSNAFLEAFSNITQRYQELLQMNPLK